MSQPSTLKLDRKLSNHVFGSWRLDSDANAAVSTHLLLGVVRPVSAAGQGFLQTKTVVTHNHLHEQQGRHYVFLQQGREPPALHRVEYKSDARGIATHRLTGAFTLHAKSLIQTRKSSWADSIFDACWHCPAAADRSCASPMA